MLLRVVESCSIFSCTTANTDIRTPNIIGPTMLGVVASVCTSFLLMSLATELRLGATLRSLAFANYFMYLYA